MSFSNLCVTSPGAANISYLVATSTLHDLMCFYAPLIQSWLVAVPGLERNILGVILELAEGVLPEHLCEGFRPRFQRVLACFLRIASCLKGNYNDRLRASLVPSSFPHRIYPLCVRWVVLIGESFAIP
jgi:hypothetical protein